MFARRKVLRLGAVAALSLVTSVIAGPASRAADQPLPVVASFSILGDMVASVGGERVRVTTLVGPDGDAHVFEPTPSDARAVAAAKVVFVNGLGLEQGWLPRLIQASGFAGPVVVTTTGITPLRMEEEGEGDGDGAGAASGTSGAEHQHSGMVDDPHAWQDLANGKVYVRNIEAGLAAADPEGTATYRANAEAYLREIDALNAEVEAKLAAIPEARRKIVTTHDAFQYFGKAYGIELLAPEGLSTEAEASAADVAALIHQIREQRITAVFFENMSDNRLLNQISKETAAKIGGTVYSDALSPPDGPAPTYLLMFRHNVTAFTTALAGS